MTKSRVFLSSVALSLLLSPLVPLASAQPMPPPPPMPELRVRVVPMDRPHEMRREVAPARPSKNHKWIKGYYHHDGSDWRWTEGRWAEPPARRARWIAPQYKKVHGGYRYAPGHWSTEVVIQN